MENFRLPLSGRIGQYALKSAEELKNWLALWHDVGEDKTETRKSIEQKIEMASKLAEEISALKNNG